MKVVAVGHGAKAISTAFGACPAVPHGPLSCSECPGSQMMLHRCSYFEKTCFLWLCPHPCLSCGAVGLTVSSPRPQDVPTVCDPTSSCSVPPAPSCPQMWVPALGSFLPGRGEGRHAGTHDQMVFLCWRSIRT